MGMARAAITRMEGRTLYLHLLDEMGATIVAQSPKVNGLDAEYFGLDSVDTIRIDICQGEDISELKKGYVVTVSWR